MNASFFFEWLPYVHCKFVKTDGRNVLLLMDNYSAHGKKETPPELEHIGVVFLPSNMASKLQQLDAGIIDEMKRRYINLQMEHTVYLKHVKILDIYKNNILTIMNWLTDI